MGFMQDVCLLLTALVVLVNGQGPPPRPPGFRPPSTFNRINPFGPGPVVPTSTLFKTYCPLAFQSPFKDPAILEAAPAQLAAARARAMGRVNDDQRLYLDGKRQQATARAARRSSDQGRGGPGRGAGPSNPSPGRAPGRSKRQTPDIALLAPTNKKAVCQSVEKVVQSVLSEDGQVCYLFSEDEIKYWECASNFASMPNPDIQLQRFYCESDNYVYQSVLSFCPDADDVRWVTIYIPISCCSRRHACDFTPYSSNDGPKRFAQ